MEFQIEYLESRLMEIENATKTLMYMLDNEDSTFYGSPFMKNHLTKLVTEGAAVRRKLAEVRNGK